MKRTDELSDFLHLCLPPSPVREYNIEEINELKWEIIRRLRGHDEMGAREYEKSNGLDRGITPKSIRIDRR